MFTIIEYGGFYSNQLSAEKDIDGGKYQSLPQETFDKLEAFILENRDSGKAAISSQWSSSRKRQNNDSDETEAIELLSLSSWRGIGKIITAKNYVGVITLKDGTTIEILPKIHNADKEKTRQIFLEMLKTLKDLPDFKRFNTSNLDTKRLNLFEIFIRMFIAEIETLTKQGLKSAYHPVEQNERFYKGKLLVGQNLKYNLVNRARFFVRYDEFNLNRPENRLIKSTVIFLR
jgi:5-methylcytosine-specific restriction enzyme subunit McrC